MVSGGIPQPGKVRFGLFEMDLVSGQLRKQGRTVRLQELPLRVLAALLETPGELVTHERLHEKVWGATVVDYEDGLHTAVRKLRDALGDSASHPLYVMTLPRRGYRFIAPVSLAGGQTRETWTRPFSGRPLMGACVFATLLALAFLSLWLRSRSEAHTSGEQGKTLLESTPVTSYPGVERSPGVSPDGRWVAFAWNGDHVDNLDIYIQRIAGGTPTRLTTNPSADDFPTWSPDGRRIAFLRDTSIYLVPSVGGREVRFTQASGPGLAWSPDGSIFAFSDRSAGESNTSIFVAAVDTGARRRLTPPNSVTSDELPQFSWDGKEIAFVRRRTTVSEIFVVPAEGGQVRQLTTFGQPVDGLAWRPDNQAVVFGGPGGLFSVPAHSPGRGRPVRLPVSDMGAGQPAFSRPTSQGGSALVFSWFPTNTKIWSMPVGRTGSGTAASPARVASSNLGDWAPAISPDGKKVAFCSRRTSFGEIWVSDVDGSSARQLTTFGRGPGPESLSWSPDGDLIAFDATLDGNRDVYLVRADGAALTRLTTDPADDALPSWSRNHQWIYFMSDRSGARQIWRMRGDGGQPTALTKNGGYQPFESPEGRSVFYTKGQSQPGLWSVPVDGGAETPVLDAVWSGSWDVARDGVYYVDFAHSAPARYPLNFYDVWRAEALTIAKVPMCVPRGLRTITVRQDGGLIAWTSSGERNSDLKIVPHFRW